MGTQLPDGRLLLHALKPAGVRTGICLECRLWMVSRVGFDPPGPVCTRLSRV
jgi:hypothetical protein